MEDELIIGLALAFVRACLPNLTLPAGETL